MTKRRRNLTRLQKVRIFDRDHGICHLCSLRIQVGQPWEISHKTSLWADGSDDQADLGPAHKHPCHRKHTDEETPIRAKTTRMRANHLGIPKSREAKLPAGRDSRDRKKLNGQVVPREARYEKHRRVMEARVVR